MPDQIIVVDDSSTDDSGNCARELGAQLVVLTKGPRGPAWARNRGAEIATGDVLLFIDADVMVHSDTVPVIERKLTDQPEIAAVFGSYDLHPPGRGVVSRYKNLMHHYVHQHAPARSIHVLGRLWRDPARRFSSNWAVLTPALRSPSIEDIELGSRLRDAGLRVWLCRDVLVTHLKEWSLVSMLRSDIRDRAVPWSRLILSRGKLPNDLNVDIGQPPERIRSMGGCIVPGSWILFCLGLARYSGGSLRAGLAQRRRFTNFLLQQGGVVLAIVGAGLAYIVSALQQCDFRWNLDPDAS